VSDQLVHAVEPVFWMVRLAPNWLELCGEMVYVTLQAVCAARVDARTNAATSIIPHARKIRYFMVCSLYSDAGGLALSFSG